MTTLPPSLYKFLMLLKHFLITIRYFPTTVQIPLYTSIAFSLLPHTLLM